jgi:hypothetical protein
LLARDVTRGEPERKPTIGGAANGFADGATAAEGDASAPRQRRGTAESCFAGMTQARCGEPELDPTFGPNDPRRVGCE